MRFPIEDRRGDRFSWNNSNSFDINDSSIVKQDIEYDPVSKQYYIIEKIGNTVYRKPTYLTFDEFYKLQAEASEKEYFNSRSRTLFDLNRKIQRPKPIVYDKLFDRIFGVGPQGLKVDIKPQGSVDLTAGYQGQNIKNPTLPEAARKNGGFDFNMDANVNIMANIGDKLKLPISYNTLANFDFENQLKLDYKGMDDEILKSVEAGNISFQSKGTLMASVQSLFGLKTQLQFGKLFITAAIASQRSQRQSLTLQGGGLNQTISKRLDDYDENKHFLLAQYFKNNYDKAMKTLPVVNSQVQILRLEVWVTNRNGATTNTRGIVGLMDLAESSPYNSNVHSLTNNQPNLLPENGNNDLYPFLADNDLNRNPAMINTILLQRGLTPVNDFEKTFARLLQPSEYYFNPQVGFISLNQQLQPDDVLAVAYQYTYNGKVFQVGEFSQDVTVDSTQGVQKVLFLKLLKATSQRPELPLWDLMMKNIYSLDITGLQRDGFNLNVFYQEPSGGMKRYLPESNPQYSGRPLLSILNLDRLNNRNDPLPDGQWDFVDSFTVLSQQGKIIFPELQPFGKYLDTTAFEGQSQAVKDKYIYQQLYDSIKAIAQTYANLDRFYVQGTIKGSSNTDIYLGGFNIPPGSVSVSAGGQTLQENIDYVIDYNLGTLKVINQSIINSGIPVNVQYENNASFGIQQRSFMGLRLDYLVNKKLSLGATMERLTERPFFTKVNYGEDPIQNTMYGVDFNYRSELPGVTRLLNKLPFFDSKVISNINAYGEAAVLKPGHPSQIGKGNEGLIYIDDFEGTTSSIDLRFPFVSWVMASTPQGKFPEATLTNNLQYGYNRSKFAWYNIEPTLQDKSSPNNPLRGNLAVLSDPRVRAVYTNELFPQRTTNITDVLNATFDMAYYPMDLGPYNFTKDASNLDVNGKLKNPKQRWGGIMRNIDQTDFETSNIEFIEFWVQDPFLKNPLSTGGKLLINLGNISEDVLKDGMRFYENGLNTPNQPAAVDSANSVWGKVPVNPIQVTQAFSNDPADRQYQDLGFDGEGDESEKKKQAQYLTDLAATFGTSSPVYQKASLDPSNDNYKWYRDQSYDANGTGLLGRYKNYNNPQGNSPVATGNSQFSPAATLYPDNEDLNRDNTLNETEEYYEYQIDLKPGMDVGVTKYITDKRVITPRLANGTTSQETWYLFRIPIKNYTGIIGKIPDFKSIRFIRMYMTDFEDSVVMRFASLDLVRNQWRTFTYQLDTTGSYTPIPTSSNTTVNVLAVNIEENSSREPIPYKIPPGIERVQLLGNNGINLLQNEQSMSLKINNLAKGDARAVFKTLNLDLRQYGQMSMFLHAESVIGQRAIQDGELNAVIRIGQDFLNNYYEIKIPLKITPFGITAAADIWPIVNNLDILLNDLVQLKLRRNNSGFSVSTIYREILANRTISVLGNPNLGEVQGFLIGVQNASAITEPLSTEVWIDELRLSRIDENGGFAALGRVDMQLADLGTLSVSANTYTQGFGTIEQHVNERARNDMFQFDAALTMDAGKLLPKNTGLSIPVYASINKTILTPQYDPYDKDVLYDYKLKNAGGKQDSIRNVALDETTIKTINFTNVRFGQNTKKIKLWSPGNFDFSYSYTKFEQSTPLILLNTVVKHRVGFGYTYTTNPKYIEPFKKTIKNKSPWFNIIRDFNFNPTPSLLSFRADINRQFGKFTPRIVNTYDNTVERVDTTYDKYFTFDRYYNLRWDLTRSLNFDFSATNSARIDEPYGLLNTKQKRDTVKNNFFSGGRNTLYQQRAVFSYNLPLAKLPLTDWITTRYSYTTTYNWIGASLLAFNLGNTIENSQQNALTTELDFSKLYSKSKWLNKINQPSEPGDQTNNTTNPQSDTTIVIKPREEVIKGLKGHNKRTALRKWRQQKRDARKVKRNGKPVNVTNGVLKSAVQVATMVKRVSVNYSENYNSRLPGYIDTTEVLGQNWKTMQPGMDYVFGKQPDTTWLNKKAAQGVITRDSTFNLLFNQNFEQRLSLSAQLEPIREFVIDVNLDKSFSKNYSELFKDTTGTGNGDFEHLSPLAGGGFSVSYISYKTLFEKYKPTEVSETFNKFQDYRETIANRLAQSNPYWKAQGSQYTPDGYPQGYGRYAQDVLIPAFIAAYTGKDPNNVALIDQSNSNIKTNPFRGIKPLPNWRVTYTGLTKIPAVANILSNVSLTHAYSSTLSMNTFTSALLYYDPFHYGAPAFLDTISGNYIPFFLVPNLTIQEQFAPLFGIDITTSGQTNLRFEYRKSRQLSLSLIDYQLSEVRSTEWSFGGSFRQRGIHLPFKLPFIKDTSEQGNDVNINLDLSLRDDIQSNSRLDQANAYSTGGQKVFTLQPSIDYVVSNRVNIKLYFDQQRVIPYISTSAPVTNTRAGIQIRISLAPQ